MNKKKFFKRLLALSLISSSLFLAASVGETWSDCKAFLSAISRNPKDMGAALPSSKGLAQKITRYVVCEGTPVRILEVGAGTGSFSKEIIKKMRPQDTLVLIELDAQLCEVLKEKFGHHKNVQVQCISFLDWHPGHRYDFIVSGVPHHNLPEDVLNQFLDAYQNLLSNKGTLSFFEYGPIARTVAEWWRSGEVQGPLDKFTQSFSFDKDIILLNVPPARVHHLRIEC